MNKWLWNRIAFHLLLKLFRHLIFRCSFFLKFILNCLIWEKSGISLKKYYQKLPKIVINRKTVLYKTSLSESFFKFNDLLLLLNLCNINSLLPCSRDDESILPSSSVFDQFFFFKLWLWAIHGITNNFLFIYFFDFGDIISCNYILSL